MQHYPPLPHITNPEHKEHGYFLDPHQNIIIGSNTIKCRVVWDRLDYLEMFGEDI